MRNFTGPGVFPAIYRICITQVAPKVISLVSSTQLPFQFSFAGATGSSLIIINQNIANENYYTHKNVSIQDIFLCI